MNNYSKTWQNCATCEFWVGPRAPDHWRERVEVENDAKGECTGKTWNRSQKTATQSCSDWKAWSVLK